MPPSTGTGSTAAGGTFESDTGGTYQSDTPGTFQTVTDGTFQSDTGGTSIPLLSEYVLGKLSKAFTILTFALILEAIGLSVCDTTAKEENKAVDALVVHTEKSDSTEIVCIFDEIIENKDSAIEIE